MDARIKSLQSSIDASSAQLKKYLEQIQGQVSDAQDKQDEIEETIIEESAEA